MTQTEKRGSVRMVGGVYLSCKDPKTLAQWYSDALGMKLKAVPERKAYGLEFTYLDAHDKSNKSYVFALVAEGGGPAGGGMVGLRVDDLDGLLARLKAAGVTASKIETAEWGRLAYVEDPEGHRLELWQPTQAPAAAAPVTPQSK
jgi:catechol 2,3-dioxygenase-like lactoylglutathione lyase family enzyme